MNTIFFHQPVILPLMPQAAEKDLRAGFQALTQRALEVSRAAALILREEPGLLTSEDLDTARRRGQAAARRQLNDCPPGKPRIAYYRALSAGGFHYGSALETLANRVWILEDRCGLADRYLRAVADTALQHRAGCVLCPSPLRRDRLEAVFLPEAHAAFLSEKCAPDPCPIPKTRIRLDRIPAPERRQALRSALAEDRRTADSLLRRAAALLSEAEILANLEN